MKTYQLLQVRLEARYMERLKAQAQRLGLPVVAYLRLLIDQRDEEDLKS